MNQRVDRPRRDTIVPESGWDSYREGEQPKEPAVCPSCRIVFKDGRWTSASRAPRGATEHVCPACRRIRERNPAGFLELGGPFFANHRQEILNLVNNEAAAETAEHPLHRIMATEDTDGGALITTTDIHLPRRIGEALGHAYKGEFTYEYLEDDTILRLRWSR